MSWIWYGLRRGILTTRYPFKSDEMPSAYRGEVEPAPAALEAREQGAHACLSRALDSNKAGTTATIETLRCFQCGECARRSPAAYALRNRFDLARVNDDPERVREALRARSRAWGSSVHLRHVDAGSDGSEEQELQAIFNPFYDANRLGIFLTAAPRHADILIVTGVVTNAMRDPLARTYDAMPEPKSVIALGTSACSGGIFAGMETVVGPVNEVLPVDVFIPGGPPAPLSILHGLWVALGRMLARRTVT